MRAVGSGATADASRIADPAADAIYTRRSADTADDARVASGAYGAHAAQTAGAVFPLAAFGYGAVCGYAVAAAAASASFVASRSGDASSFRIVHPSTPH